MLNGQIAVSNALERSCVQLAELQTLSADACITLRDMARGLADTGRPPTIAATDRLRIFRSQFERLQASVMRSGNSIHREEHSLRSLREELEAQHVVQTTLARLDSLAMIQHAEQREFAPWQRCLAEAVRLRQELLSSPATAVHEKARQFLEPQTPLNAIITLVIEGSQLSDERWTVLLDSASAAYGREITTAIARGKLVLMSGTRA